MVDGLSTPSGGYQSQTGNPSQRGNRNYRRGRAKSHTGAMTGSFAVFRSVCSQANIIMADTIDEMVDIAGLLLSQPEIKGKADRHVTQGGGLGVLSADLCEAAGLEVPPLNDRVVGMLDAYLPPFWSNANPVDLVAPGKVSMITDSTAALLAHADMDAIVLLGLGYMTSRARRWLESMFCLMSHGAACPENDCRRDGASGSYCRANQTVNKPILPVIDVVGFDDPDEGNIVKHLDAKGIMAYSSPEQAIRALTKAQNYYQKRRAREQY